MERLINSYKKRRGSKASPDKSPSPEKSAQLKRGNHVDSDVVKKIDLNSQNGKLNLAIML